MNPVEKSKAEANSARDRLNATFDEVRKRTQPEALLGTAKVEARKQATKVAIVALSNAKFRPMLAIGVATSAIAYLFRNPILKALNKSLGQGERHD